jgi:RNA polymerase sigma-70 factor, ECF subfamily
MDERDEKALVEGLIRMEPDAWSAFVRRYHRPLAVFVAVKYGADAGTCEEIVHMTFVRCVRSIRTFDGTRGTLLGWLKAVAANEGHRLARQNERRLESPVSQLPPELAAVAEGAYDDAPPPDEVLARKDFQAAVRDALTGVNPRHGEVLEMKYLEGLTAGEIGTKLDMKVEAVEALLARARAAFRTALKRRLGARDVQIPEKDR